MQNSIWIYILLMSGATYAVRVLPLTLLRKPIRNRFFRSFLFYVPYATLAVMTFPAILHAARSPVAGGAALVLGIVSAWFGAGLFPVALICCASVFLLELFL
ncbi:MAG: AzlD domain-containing protein [Lentisphaeria bacterium]|nr:AzlD domain-containing protein [Lentisphaeria bacterium]